MHSLVDSLLLLIYAAWCVMDIELCLDMCVLMVIAMVHAPQERVLRIPLELPASTESASPLLLPLCVSRLAAALQSGRPCACSPCLLAHWMNDGQSCVHPPQYLDAYALRFA